MKQRELEDQLQARAKTASQTGQATTVPKASKRATIQTASSRSRELSFSQTANPEKQVPTRDAYTSKRGPSALEEFADKESSSNDITQARFTSRG